MTTNAPRRIAAFTLIEMIVVIAIVMLMLGTLMSGLATMQKSADTLSTPAIIQAVHESCFRNARQFGSAALVYGFTLDFGDGVKSPGDKKTSRNGFADPAVIPGEYSAIAIIPWVIDASGTTKRQANIDLFTDIGRQPLWDASNNRIYFDDKLRPSNRVGTQTAAAAPPAIIWNLTSGNRYVHVGYEPRTGLVHVDVGGTADPATAGLTAPAITAPTSLPKQLTLELRHTKSNQVKNKILITYTGVIDAHAKL